MHGPRPVTYLSFRWSRQFSRAGLLGALIVLALASSAAAERARNVQTTFRSGQTFVTFSEISASTATYSVYRSTQPITSVTGLTPVATLKSGSGIYLHTGKGFVISDLGPNLPAGTGLFVYTAKAAGTYYYAVTNSTDASIVAGENATAIGVAESVAAVPGAVQIGPSFTNFDCIVTPYFAWEDYSTWDPGWGYYGYRFNVVIKGSAPKPGEQLPLVVRLHGGGNSSYFEPDTFVNAADRSVSLIPVDFAFLNGLTDPYTGQGRFYSRWFGYQRRSGPAGVAPVTERRVARYARFVAARPEFQIDPTRIYLLGASMGGGGSMHNGYHYGDLYAAVASATGWVNLTAWGGMTECEGDPVVEGVGVPCSSWQDQAWVVQNSSLRKPFITYMFNKNDAFVNTAPFPDLLTKTEAAREGYAAEWRDLNHEYYFLTGHLSWYRFRLNEAYPAFSNASSSDPVGAVVGQRNMQFDWSSSLRSMGTGTEIVDTAQTFQMTMKSLNGATATTDVTIRNAQLFRPLPGETVSWTTSRTDTAATIQSGSATADGKGLVTVRIQILTTGSNLRLQRSGTTTPPPPASPTNVRIIR